MAAQQHGEGTVGFAAEGKPTLLPTRPPRRRSGWGLSRRPLLSLVLAAAIPVLLFGGWVAYVTAEQERASARNKAFETVERVADRIAAEMAMQVQIAETLAASAALDRPDLDGAYEELARVRSSRPLWETVELTDLAGNQVLNLLRPFGAPLGPTADRETFDLVIRTGRATVSGIGPVGPVSGKRLVALRAPVLRDGQVRYVLSIHFVPEAVSTILRKAGAPKDWVGAVVDARGNIIARTLAEETELGRPAAPTLRNAIALTPSGSYIGSTLEGIRVETAYHTLADTGGWSVHLGIPTDVLDAPVTRSLFLFATGGVASLGLATALGLLMASDMAQRQRDEEARAALALKVSEARGAVAVEAAELDTWRLDVEQGAFSGSERCRALLGLAQPPAEADGDAHWPSRALLAAVHDDDREAVREAIASCLSDDEPIDVEFRAVRPGAGTHWVRATGRAERFDHEPAKVVHGVIADVEPRKRAEAERLDLLRRLAEAQEDEQRRIARELHDQVGQTVTGLSLGLKGLETMLGRDNPGEGARTQVRWLQGLATDIGRDIHRAALDLRPTALDDLGLHGALASYASNWSDRYGVSTDVQTLGSVGRLPLEVETVAYRVVQEALTNVLKHARARNVSVVLERRPNQLRIVVEDDGIGFDPAAPGEGDEVDGSGAKRPRLGLSGMRERLSLINGVLTLESAAGSGTTLFVQIPLSPNDGHDR